MTVDELHPVITQYGETTAKGKIDEGDGFDQRPVFGVRVAVILGDLFVGDAAKLRALLAEIVVK